MHTISYREPAKKWREALPLGNGHTGIMIYGSLKKECLCFKMPLFGPGILKIMIRREAMQILKKYAG